MSKWGRVKENFLKYQRKILVGLGIILSPIVISMIGYYCQEFYLSKNIQIDRSNYGVMLALFSFMIIIMLSNLVSTIYIKGLTKDTHNIVQLLFEVYLEDSDRFKIRSEEVLNYFKKYGGDK